MYQTPEQRISDLIQGSNRQLEEKRKWREIAERYEKTIHNLTEKAKAQQQLEAELLKIVSDLRQRELALEAKIIRLERGE